MTADWSRDAPDLMIALDRTGIPLALQIQEQLRVAIRKGRLLAGERLPSTRRLADHLRVSRGTVVEVYEQLVAEGYVDSAVGSGTRVARIPGVERRERTEAPPAAPARPTFEIDFGYGIPDLGSVPLREWVWAVGEATRTLPTAGLGDEEPAGSRHLREVVTAYHRRVRAGCATADDTVSSAASAKVWPSPSRPSLEPASRSSPWRIPAPVSTTSSPCAPASPSYRFRWTTRDWTWPPFVRARHVPSWSHRHTSAPPAWLSARPAA